VLSLIFGTANPQEVALAFLHSDNHDKAIDQKSHEKTWLGSSSIPSRLNCLNETFLAIEKALLRYVEQSLLESATDNLLALAQSRLSRFWAEAIDLLTNRVSCDAGIALMVAIYSALKKHAAVPGLLVLGDLSIQGNIKSAWRVSSSILVLFFFLHPGRILSPGV